MSALTHVTPEELNKKFEMLPLKKKIEVYKNDIIAELRQMLFYKFDRETKQLIENILRDKLCRLGKYQAEYESQNMIRGKRNGR